MINFIERKEPIIIDTLMGGGKTTFAIQMINKSHLTQKFIVVTPYLTEIDRLKKATKHKRNFIDPDNRNSKGTKLQSLKQLLENGADIVTTHALFKEADEELLDLLLLHQYTLVLDEVSEVIEKFDVKKSDIQMMVKSGQIEVDAVGKVKWVDKEYDGKFNYLRRVIETENVFLNGGTAFIWSFPISAFLRFRQVYILTFMFHAQIQRYYFDLNGLKYTMKSVAIDDTETGSLAMVLKDGELTARVVPVYKLVDYSKPDVSHLKELINICDCDRLNSIGDSTTAQGFDCFTFTKLTSMKKSSPIGKAIRNNLYNWFRNRNNASSSQVMWTTAKESKALICPRGYSQGFVSSNLRASNDYRNRTVLGYCLNRYMNPSIEGFFTSFNVAVDQDAYALSELVQWLFRSAVRDGKPVELYIPSQRMRKLLEMWLNGEEI